MQPNDIHQLAIETETTPEGWRVIRPKGWITTKNTPEFEAAIGDARGVNTIIDLTDVPYMDSSGLGSLLKGYVAYQKYGGRFVLAGVAPRICDLLKLTKVDALFPMYSTPSDAASALAKSAGK
jgi:anti-sigma B factor antagonist